MKAHQNKGQTRQSKVAKSQTKAAKGLLEPLPKSDLSQIPGLGRTFLQDFARIRIHQQKQLQGKKAEDLFARLVRANQKVYHKTSRNYLYVIRMAIYYADGGRDPKKLKWSAWTDKKLATAD